LRFVERTPAACVSPITSTRPTVSSCKMERTKNNQNTSVYQVYDELNRLTLERDALNGDTQYTYDLLGNLTSITDAEGQVTTFVYDDLGRLVETIDPVVESPSDKTDKVLLYDEAGNVLLTEDRSGRQRRHTYDVLNRLTRTEYLLDGSEDVYRYDAFGDLSLVGNGPHPTGLLDFYMV